MQKKFGRLIKSAFLCIQKQDKTKQIKPYETTC